MILYKYVSYSAGRKILESNSIGFTQPNNFNDPFELEAGYPQASEEEMQKNIFSNFNVYNKKEIWKRNTGVLSLTRQPINALMWAHYGKQHTGMVIGIDSSIDEFTCEKKNTIPVQYGNVIYTNKKPEHGFISSPTDRLNIGDTTHFSKEHLEQLQRLFLYKSMCWSYEEEVRVAKCLNGVDDYADLASGSSVELKSGSFTMLKTDDKKKTYLLALPKGAIKEVYFGCWSGFLEDEEKFDDIRRAVKSSQPHIKIYSCRASNESWELKCSDYTVGSPFSSRLVDIKDSN